MIINSVSTSFYETTNLYTLNIPKHSKVLDVIIDNYNQIYLSYSNDNYIDYNDDNKDVYIYIVKSYESNAFVPDGYTFLRTSSINTIDFQNSSGGNSLTINSEVIQENFLIFLDENKQVEEKRDENLNKIL